MEPVFAAMERCWERSCSSGCGGDWRAGQAQEVRGVLAVPAQRVWVAEAGGEPIGFVAATLRQSGMLVAVIETGGDLGHTPARRIYEEAGYTALPAVRPDCVSGRGRAPARLAASTRCAGGGAAR